MACIKLSSKQKEYLPTDLQQRWNGLEKKTRNNKKIKVANTGLVSSGKSTLFNVLIDPQNVDESHVRFAVGAARTTSIQDVAALTEEIDLADTPGIDVNFDDNAVALSSILESDIIVMVHNIKLGALNNSEYTWLQQIAQNMLSEKERKARLIFVCSWIDERDGDKNIYNQTIAETKQMVKDAVGCEIDFFEVSAKRYITGKQKGKEQLVERSNITKIRKCIIQKATVYAKSFARIMEYQVEISLCEETVHKFTMILKDKTEQKEKISKQITSKYARKKEEWHSIFNSFKQRLARVREKKRIWENM